MKIISIIIGLIIVASTAFAADTNLFPFGKIVRGVDQKPIPIVVRIVRLDSQDKIIGVNMIFTGKLHETINKNGYAVVIDKFHHSAIDVAFDASVQKLRTLKHLPAGNYSIFLSVDGDYKQFNITNAESVGILEVGIDELMPVISTYEVTAKPVDMTDANAVKINNESNSTQAKLSLNAVIGDD